MVATTGLKYRASLNHVAIRRLIVTASSPMHHPTTTCGTVPERHGGSPGIAGPTKETTDIFRVLLLFVALALAALVLPSAAAAERGEPLAKHVVMIDWDGFDPDFLGRTPTPNLDALARAGTMALADSTYHTISNPARASMSNGAYPMSTGAYPEVHGNAAYVFDPFANQAIGQTRVLEAETIAESLAAQGRTVASVQWYMIQGPRDLLRRPGAPVRTAGRQLRAPRQRRDRHPQAPARRLQWDAGDRSEDPDLLAIYSSDLDGRGHQVGPDHPDIAPADRRA